MSNLLRLVKATHFSSSIGLFLVSVHFFGAQRTKEPAYIIIKKIYGDILEKFQIHLRYAKENYF